MKKVLILLAHPNIKDGSRLNNALIQKVAEADNVTIHNLYEEYPNYDIDVKREQSLLLDHDVIVMQFPFYWFGSPSLLKEWIDVVLTTDFAFEDNFLLEGKKFLICTTAGVSKEAYVSSGVLVHDYLNNFVGMADDIKVKYQKPFIVHGSPALQDNELDLEATNYKRYLLDLAKDRI